MMDLSLLTALTIGFLGSTHCIGMCGGIVGALNAGLPQTSRQPRFTPIAYHITYNAGQILSYSVAGGLAGLIGAQSSKIPLETVLPLGGLIAGLFMIVLGLYLAGWQRAFAWIESAGGHLWKYVQPLVKRFLPVNTPIHFKRIIVLRAATVFFDFLRQLFAYWHWGQKSKGLFVHHH